MPVIRAQFDPDEAPHLIQAVLDTFDFTLPGVEGSLGRDLAVAAAISIEARCMRHVDPDGVPWRANGDEPFWWFGWSLKKRSIVTVLSPIGYASYKKLAYEVSWPGELGGQMLSYMSILGNPVVTKNRVEMVYGLGITPTRTAAQNGTQMTDSELKTTDRDKAWWFTEGGRRFFELDQTDQDHIVARAQEALNQHLRHLGF